MKLYKFLCSTFLTLFFLTGCHYKVTAYDPKAIDKAVQSIQQKMEEGDYESLYMVSSDKLKEEVTQEQFLDVMKTARQRLGKRLSKNHSINIVENIDGQNYISSIYNSHFEKCPATEKFTFLKNNSTYFFAGYHYDDTKCSPSFVDVSDKRTIELLGAEVEKILSMIDAQDYSSIYQITTREMKNKYSEKQYSASLADIYADTGKHIESNPKTITLHLEENGQYFVVLDCDILFEKNKGSGEFHFLYDPDSRTYTFSGYRYNLLDGKEASVDKPFRVEGS
jgi:hypothetical protein